MGTRLLARLKEHALTLGVLHLLTYADDSATGFFEKSGFDPDHQARRLTHLRHTRRPARCTPRL